LRIQNSTCAKTNYGKYFSTINLSIRDVNTLTSNKILSIAGFRITYSRLLIKPYLIPMFHVQTCIHKLQACVARLPKAVYILTTMRLVGVS